MVTKIGIVGYGEIGSSIEKLYLGKRRYKVFIKDLDRDDGILGVKYLHICIPYTEDFIPQVCEYIKTYSPEIVIINSTVIPGTTREIIKRCDHSHICHSPVRGVHPKLYEGLKVFEKYIGVVDVGSLSQTVESHFNDLGIKTKVVSPVESSELAKMASTSYYGLCIAWHGEMAKLCQTYGTDFEDVMTNWNLGYNEGYKLLGMGNVVRPVLYPPSDKIGGHCILPNAELMGSFFTSEALDLILKYK